MRKVNNRRGLTLLIIILLLSAYAGKKYVDRTVLLNPISIVQRFQEAINTKNGDIALDLLADDAVFEIDGMILASGDGEITDWVNNQILLNFQFTGNAISTDSGVSIEPCEISSDQYIFYGIDELSGTCDFQSEDGFIIRFGIQFDESTKLSLLDSLVASNEDILGIWHTKNYYAESGQIYLQLYENGVASFMNFPEGSFIIDDSSYIGSNLTWEYSSNVFRVQNVGLASEKYCLEEEVGLYIVKLVGDYGLKFRLISDPCRLREFLLQLPPRWISYLP